VSVRKLVVHSDVLLDHLCGAKSPSTLRQAMGMFFCYTTVFQAIELFEAMRGPRERKAARDVLSAMKILGLNAKNAPSYGRLFAAHPGLASLDLLVAGLCIDSRLPLLTGRGKDFRGIRGLAVIPPGDIAREFTKRFSATSGR